MQADLQNVLLKFCLIKVRILGGSLERCRILRHNSFNAKKQSYPSSNFWVWANLNKNVKGNESTWPKGTLLSFFCELRSDLSLSRLQTELRGRSWMQTSHHKASNSQSTVSRGSLFLEHSSQFLLERMCAGDVLKGHCNSRTRGYFTSSWTSR